MINDIWWRAFKTCASTVIILLYPLTVLLFWSAMFCWIMLVGMDLSPKGMLLKWCMWVCIWCIAVFARSERWEYQNKETSQNILFFWFNTDTYTTRKTGKTKHPHAEKPASHTLYMMTHDVSNNLNWLDDLFIGEPELLHLLTQCECIRVLGKLWSGWGAGQPK